MTCWTENLYYNFSFYPIKRLAKFVIAVIVKSSIAFAPANITSAALTILLPFILTALAPITPAATPTPAAATRTTFPFIITAVVRTNTTIPKTPAAANLQILFRF